MLLERKNTQNTALKAVRQSPSFYRQTDYVLDPNEVQKTISNDPTQFANEMRQKQMDRKRSSRYNSDDRRRGGGARVGVEGGSVDKRDRIQLAECNSQDDMLGIIQVTSEDEYEPADATGGGVESFIVNHHRNSLSNEALFRDLMSPLTTAIQTNEYPVEVEAEDEFSILGGDVDVADPLSIRANQGSVNSNLLFNKRDSNPRGTSKKEGQNVDEGEEILKRTSSLGVNDGSLPGTLPSLIDTSFHLSDAESRVDLDSPRTLDGQDGFHLRNQRGKSNTPNLPHVSGKKKSMTPAWMTPASGLTQSNVAAHNSPSEPSAIIIHASVPPLSSPAPHSKESAAAVEVNPPTNSNDVLVSSENDVSGETQARRGFTLLSTPSTEWRPAVASAEVNPDSDYFGERKKGNAQINSMNSNYNRNPAEEFSFALAYRLGLDLGTSPPHNAMTGELPMTTPTPPRVNVPRSAVSHSQPSRPAVTRPTTSSAVHTRRGRSPSEQHRPQSTMNPVHEVEEPKETIREKSLQIRPVSASYRVSGAANRNSERPKSALNPATRLISSQGQKTAKNSKVQDIMSIYNKF